MQQADTCSHCKPKNIWYKNKIIIIVFILVILLSISYFFPILEPFRQSFLAYSKKIWWAVILGLLIGGLIDYYIPREYVSYILAGSRKKTIFHSAVLGFLMSACSHGILAISMELHKKGASNPAVITFLLASPWANLPLTIMLIGFFGLKGLFIIFAALIVAINTGLIFQILERKSLIEKNKNIVDIGKEFSLFNDLSKRIKKYNFSFEQLKSDFRGVYKGVASLSNMILWWILIGIALASLANAYIPTHIFHKYMGPNFLGLLVTLALATILEVCSEGTSPLAFEIYRQTKAFGNSFVFLMAGVVTDYTEIGLIWFNIGRRVAIWLTIIAVPQVVLIGILANRIF
ncbi:MAG: permease [Candidatus Omnitrophota bacterium]